MVTTNKVYINATKYWVLAILGDSTVKCLNGWEYSIELLQNYETKTFEMTWYVTSNIE